MNRVAIVDDSDINLALLFKALVGKLGDCQPLPFVESRPGLAWCIEHRRDLVIAGYMMPEDLPVL